MKRNSKNCHILSRKLRAIRLSKQISQHDILRIVYPESNQVNRAMISQWEKGIREPSHHILIRYARFVNLTFEELFDDERELPSHFQVYSAESIKDYRNVKTVKDEKEKLIAQTTNTK